MIIQSCQLVIDTNQHEFKPHGTPAFPCACYLTNLTHNGTADIPWHWHEDVEIIFVCSGSVQICLSGKEFTLKQGQAIFINSNILHYTGILHGESCTIRSVVFHPNLISGTADSVFAKRYVSPLLNCDVLPAIPFRCENQWENQVIYFIKEAFDAYMVETFGYELLVREKLSHMWHEIVKNKQAVLEQEGLHANQDTIRTKAMLNFILQYYDQPLKLQQIAEAANISGRECLRCFQKTIKISPMQYLLRHRIAVSSQLLESTEETITEICNKSGFDSPSYFSLVFKRYMGYTPTDYRKKQYKS